MTTTELANKSRWTDMNDDEEGAELQLSDDGQFRVTYRFETTPEGQQIKVFKKVRYQKKVSRVSRMAAQRKARMLDLVPAQAGGSAGYGEERSIEVSAHLRSLMMPTDDNGLDDEPDNAGGAKGLQRVRKDGIKAKFNQLKRLEAGKPATGAGALFDDDFDGPEVEGFGDGGFGDRTRDGGDRFRATNRMRDDNTVRVTNLAEDVTEADVEELFKKFGNVRRTFLAVDKETQTSKGFAFVTFATREEGQRAINGLDRHGYNSLLMHVEWSKPKVIH